LVVRLRNRALEWREIEGEIVGVDLDKSEYLAINRSGAVLWPALAQGATKSELAAKLVETFDLDPDAAAKDVDAFIAALSDQGLIEE
jgi:hypothetical protein